MAGYIVTAAAVRVVVGASALIVEQGNRLPEGVSQGELERLVEKQMVTKAGDPVDVPAEPVEPVDEGGVKPLGDMTLAELRAYADEHEIDLGGASRKPEVIDAITAAQA